MIVKTKCPECGHDRILEQGNAAYSACLVGTAPQLAVLAPVCVEYEYDIWDYSPIYICQACEYETHDWRLFFPPAPGSYNDDPAVVVPQLLGLSI